MSSDQLGGEICDGCQVDYSHKGRGNNSREYGSCFCIDGCDRGV